MLHRLGQTARRLWGLAPNPSSFELQYPQIRKFDRFFLGIKTGEQSCPWALSVDLGSGSEPRNPFFCTRALGVDIASEAAENIVHCNLAVDPLPFEAGSVDVVTAYDLIEHIPRVSVSRSSTRFPFIDLMDEVHRILRSGGFFFAKTPAYPFAAAFVDPTHVNIITEDTMPLYFCSTKSRHPQASRYGFKGSFELVKQCWWGGSWLLTLMKKN